MKENEKEDRVKLIQANHAMNAYQKKTNHDCKKKYLMIMLVFLEDYKEIRRDVYFEDEFDHVCKIASEWREKDSIRNGFLIRFEENDNLQN